MSYPTHSLAGMICMPTTSDLASDIKWLVQTFLVYLHGFAMVATICLWYVAMFECCGSVMVSMTFKCYCMLLRFVCEWAASVQVKPENFMSLCSGAMHALWAMVQQSSHCTCRYRSWIYRKPKKCSMTVQVCARLCWVLRWFRRKISWHWHSFPECRVMRHDWGMCSTTIPLPLGEWHRRWPGWKALGLVSKSMKPHTVVTGAPSYSIKVGLNILFLSHAIERSTCMHIHLFS